MRIRELTESADFDEIVSTVKQNCQPFLRVLLAEDRPDAVCWWRGYKSDEPMLRKQLRKDRKPLDTNPDVHDVLNKAMLKAGLPFNRANCFFVTTENRTAREYGKDYIFFPVGNYHTIYSDQVKDLFVSFDKITKKFNVEDAPLPLPGPDDNKWSTFAFQEVLEQNYKTIMNFFKDYYEVDAPLAEMSDAGNEILVNCPEAILVSMNAVYKAYGDPMRPDGQKSRRKFFEALK